MNTPLSIIPASHVLPPWSELYDALDRQDPEAVTAQLTAEVLGAVLLRGHEDARLRQSGEPPILALQTRLVQARWSAIEALYPEGLEQEVPVVTEWDVPLHQFWTQAAVLPRQQEVRWLGSHLPEWCGQPLPALTALATRHTPWSLWVAALKLLDTPPQYDRKHPVACTLDGGHLAAAVHLLSYPEAAAEVAVRPRDLLGLWLENLNRPRPKPPEALNHHLNNQFIERALALGAQWPSIKLSKIPRHWVLFVLNRADLKEQTQGLVSELVAGGELGELEKVWEQCPERLTAVPETGVPPSWLAWKVAPEAHKAVVGWLQDHGLLGPEVLVTRAQGRHFASWGCKNLWAQGAERMQVLSRMMSLPQLPQYLWRESDEKGDSPLSLFPEEVRTLLLAQDLETTLSTPSAPMPAPRRPRL